MEILDTKVYNNNAHESQSMGTVETPTKGHLSKHNCGQYPPQNIIGH